MAKKCLVIEAHSDDSCIGAGGFLQKLAKTHDLYFILTCVGSVEFVEQGVVSQNVRELEYRNYVSNFGGCVVDSSFPVPYDSMLDTVPFKQLVAGFDEAIQSIKPDLLIFQGSSFHQDHAVVHDAVRASLRPTFSFLPAQIMVMENPTYVHMMGHHQLFEPNFYVCLSREELSRKLEIFRRCFPSQVRESGNCLSADGITSWARYRGIEARTEFAEAFQMYSMII